jgi:hypothetical protein
LIFRLQWAVAVCSEAEEGECKGFSYFYNMKSLLVIVFFVFFYFEAFTQSHSSIDSVLVGMLNQEEPRLPTSEVKNHIGRDVYIYDIVSGRREVNDTLALLYVGRKYPRHLITIS